MLKLYYADTLMPRKVCALAQHVGAKVQYVPVDMKAGEQRSPGFLAINPNGKVPVLTDGDFQLWESNAIMCYLSDVAGADLWPHDPRRQIEVMRWLNWDAHHFTRHGGTLYFEYLVRARFGIGELNPSSVKEATENLKNHSRILNDHLSRSRYAAGDSLTVADFALAATVPYWSACRMSVADFPSIQRWHDRLSELPEWREPFPNQKAVAA
jgi:glutathione S-transferase